MTEIRLDYIFQSLYPSFINPAVKKIHFFLSFCKSKFKKIFNKLLYDNHHLFQFAKCHFRFNHPEFRSMTGGIGILCPESRSKGIDITKSRSQQLSFQLATNR